VFRDLSFRPERLRESLAPGERLVVIDEIQKLPSLLDEVHLLIERNKALRFVLTGSSARKLLRGGGNLLAGRARTRFLFPLVWPEHGRSDLGPLLLHGSLPSTLAASDPREDLRAYAGIYLAEEIRAEALTRSIEAFSRFLSVAAHANTEPFNFTKIGNDAQVPPRTVREFFSVLVDTLVGYELPPYRKLKSRKAVATSKFYFFDVGVAHALQGIGEVVPGTPAHGRALEHFVANELRAYLSYRRADEELTYVRSTSQLEVDFVLGDRVAIEVKASGSVSDRDTRGLRALAEDVKLKRRLVVCTEKSARRLDSGVEVVPVADFLARLWDDELL
jgi:uncharacterized protein